MHLIAAVPNGIILEYMPWPKNGFLEMPAGLGLEVDDLKAELRFST